MYFDFTADVKDLCLVAWSQKMMNYILYLRTTDKGVVLRPSSWGKIGEIPQLSYKKKKNKKTHNFILKMWFWQ